VSARREQRIENWHAAAEHDSGTIKKPPPLPKIPEEFLCPSIAFAAEEPSTAPATARA
jgi:hypothetical protein